MVALMVAFSPIWWAQGVTNEVYSLNLMLIPCSLWLLFYGNQRKHNIKFLHSVALYTRIVSGKSSFGDLFITRDICIY